MDDSRRRLPVISERLQELYQGYLSQNEHFVPCGVVNEEVYEASSPKLVFLLKEVNDRRQERGWSMVGFLRKQVERGLNGQHMEHPQTWKVIGVWSYAIHNNFPRYGDINTVQIAARGLRCIGMTNLKKSGGGGVANNRVIREHAERMRELWKLELEIMNPDIVICCGTFGIVAPLLGLTGSKMATGYYYSPWKHGSGSSLLISTYHPASRVKKDKLYAFLKEGLQELRERGFWHGCSHLTI